MQIFVLIKIQTVWCRQLFFVISRKYMHAPNGLYIVFKILGFNDLHELEIDLSGNYVTTKTIFNLGPPYIEWILSLFLTGYGQRSRTSFFNKCIKKNFGFLPINVEIILNTKTRLNSHGSSASFSYLRFFHIY